MRPWWPWWNVIRSRLSKSISFFSAGLGKPTMASTSYFTKGKDDEFIKTLKKTNFGSTKWSSAKDSDDKMLVQAERVMKGEFSVEEKTQDEDAQLKLLLLQTNFLLKGMQSEGGDGNGQKYNKLVRGLTAYLNVVIPNPTEFTPTKFSDMLLPLIREQ
jgi:hypothetical protein